MVKDKEQTFELEHYANLLKAKLNPKASNPVLDQIIEGVILQDKLDLNTLTNTTEHLKIQTELKALKKKGLELFDSIGIYIKELRKTPYITNDQEEELQACVHTKIVELTESDQGKPMDQITAIAFSKCRKELGIPEP